MFVSISRSEKTIQRKRFCIWQNTLCNVFTIFVLFFAFNSFRFFSKENERLKAELLETKTQLAVVSDGGREMIGVYDLIWQFSSKEGCIDEIVAVAPFFLQDLKFVSWARSTICLSRQNSWWHQSSVSYRSSHWYCLSFHANIFIFQKTIVESCFNWISDVPGDKTFAELLIL